jgi:diguanylate cyclase (GGDEF)-like protein
MPAGSIRVKPDFQERYRVLLDISRIIAGTLQPGDLYRTIYEQASRVLESTGFYVSLYDADQDQGTVVFYADRGRIERPDITYRGSDSRAIREGRPVLDSITDPGDAVMLLGHDSDDEITRSAIAAPLLRDGEVLGVISAQSYRLGAYDDADVELLVAIADLAAVAIANARAMGQLERQRREYQRLEEIGRALSASLDLHQVLHRVAVTTRDLVDADSTAVWLLRPDGKAEIAMSAGATSLPVGTVVPLPAELYRRLAQERKPLLIDRDLAAQLLPPAIMQGFLGESAIGAPLIAEDELLGLLAASHSEARVYPPHDVHLLEQLALRAAIAVANARLHEQVRLLSLTDPLTGLPNRRHMEIFLQKEFAAAERGRPLSIVLFDLDNFKRYNDTQGHQAGDDVLRRFAAVLVEHTRTMNLAARYGGDEFIAILSDTAADGALGYVDRIDAAVQGDELLSDLGVSAGVAAFDTTMADPDHLVRSADESLYRSKAERARRKPS